MNNSFNIECVESQKKYCIRWTEDGKRKSKVCKWSKKVTKEQAYEKILLIKKELENDYIKDATNKQTTLNEVKLNGKQNYSCPCGGKYDNVDKNKHLKSKRHLKFQQLKQLNHNIRYL